LYSSTTRRVYSPDQRCSRASRALNGSVTARSSSSNASSAFHSFVTAASIAMLHQTQRDAGAPLACPEPLLAATSDQAHVHQDAVDAQT
jgi:hypothetical protein